MKKMFLVILVSLVALVTAALLTITFVFSSKEHSQYDSPRHQVTGTRSSESAEHETAARHIALGIAAPQVSRKQMPRLQVLVW